MVQFLSKNRKRRLPPIVPLFVGALAATGGAASDRQTATFSSGVDLVEVYATVTDRNNEPVTGLTVADFRVAEDGAPQSITTFTAGDFPLSITVALDRSFSMAGERLALAKRAARSFIDALRPDDEVMVLAVGSEIETITPPVPAGEAGATDWNGIGVWGTTPLYDAAVQALDAIQARQGRRALLLISDGIDRHSETTAAELIARARRSGVLVYPVALGGARSSVFAELASVTGGRTFFIDDARRLEPQLAGLARELRSQYLLGYVPARPATAGPEWRSIQVTVSRADLKVRARDGYAAR